MPRKAGIHARRRLLSLLGVVALYPATTFAAGGTREPAAPAAGMPVQDNAGSRRILVLGDSLSAEYGIGRGAGWVNLLSQRVEPKGWTVDNASISGETTAGGQSRLPDLLSRHRPSITIIELGANDALRGLSMAATEENLRRMVDMAKGAGSRPLLVGMMMPPNFGAAYGRQFSEMFARIAAAEQIAFVPFLLEGFADDLTWFQSDRIHPTAKAQPRMLDNVWPVLSSML